jgi:8-oxo-dGTP pyrophosphatase MutT (NUDIX family)
VAPLPPSLIERARAFADGDGAIAPTRDAATVVLLRERAGGLETYLLRRAPSMAFAAGMYVFPGGSVDARDADAGRRSGWAGPPPATWAAWLGCDEVLARELVCAAVRETFEESGILLAGPSEDEVVGDTTATEWESDRLGLLDRSHSLGDLLARRRLVVRSDLLRAWGHWITPEFEPRRFDTRFFVAAVPDGQRTRDVGGEADRVVWLPVRAAVEQYDAGTLPMLPPTAVTLRELSSYDNLADVAAAPRDIRPLMPRVVDEDGEIRLVLDGPRGEQPADEVPS